MHSKGIGDEGLPQFPEYSWSWEVKITYYNKKYARVTVPKRVIDDLGKPTHIVFKEIELEGEKVFIAEPVWEKEDEDEFSR